MKDSNHVPAWMRLESCSYREDVLIIFLHERGEDLTCPVKKSRLYAVYRSSFYSTLAGQFMDIARNSN
jgi:hypothetical protein